MTETENLDAVLTEWGRQARSTTGHQPMPQLRTRGRRPRHFGWQLAAGAMAVAVAAALAVGLPRLLGKDGRPADPLRGITSTASARPGFQVVTYRGLSITVPASWQVGVGIPACVLSRSVVELPGFTDECGVVASPDLTLVEILEGTAPLPSMLVTSTSHTTISGLPAIRTDGVRNGAELSGRKAFGYQIPALQASVQIMPASDQIARQLEASLRVDAVDAHGCSVRSSSDAFPAPPGAGRAGMADSLVPGEPVSMTACRYIDGWLNQGATVSGAKLGAFVRTVNSLPTGLSRSALGPGLQQCPGSPSVRDALPAQGDDIYRFELSYPDGPQLLLIARLGSCGDFGISNGRRTGQLTDALATLLCDTVGCYGTWAGSLEPVR